MQLRKLLAATLLAASTATTAFAEPIKQWPPKDVTICNKTVELDPKAPKLRITGGLGESIENLTDVSGRLVGGGTSNYIGPGTCGKFSVLQDPPCYWRVTIYTVSHRAITWHVPFDVCHQNYIEITRDHPEGYIFTFSKK